jgi:hypothetical protein
MYEVVCSEDDINYRKSAVVQLRKQFFLAFCRLRVSE